MREHGDRRRLTRRTLIGVATLAIATTGTAAAGSTVGGVFNLGQLNTVTATTVLNTTAAGPALRVINAATGYALELSVARPGLAPMRLNANATGLVTYLNADKVDGKDAAAFQARVASVCPAGSSIRAINTNGTVTCEVDDKGGTDALTLGGKPASAFQVRIADACPEGSAVRAINADGTVACEADDINGGNAQQLDGLDSSDFLRANSEGWHNVGTAGEPGFSYCDGFSTRWHNPIGDEQKIGFYKDPLGTVHLRGHPRCSVLIGYGNGTIGYLEKLIFTLPQGYRPAARERHVTIVDNVVGRVDIAPTGEVTIEFPAANGQYGQETLSLDGITFRAAN